METKQLYNNREMKSLRKYIGKQLVSFLRQDNYAHAGESEAIELVMSFYKSRKFDHILDVGCGLGGTSNYIKSKGHCNNISGFDIEDEAISYAKTLYPKINFFTSNVFEVSSVLKEKFDLLCLFNSFYAFNDHKKALEELFKITSHKGQIAIFDYSDPYIGKNTPLYRNGNNGKTPFVPIKLDKIHELMNNSGWQILTIKNLNDQYYFWYDELCKLLIKNKAKVIQNFNENAFNNALSTYDNLRSAIEKNDLGGAIVYAERL
ncbi:class I SAM-dependent methyltransferase [Thiotrichales bacterium 19X7-9]|nr:class I SAM-dependent methyltransferase [Thiotrichales bacterium 19X7-9]